LVERVLAVDEQDAQAFSREQARALEAGEAGADDSYVIIPHKAGSKLFTSQSSLARLTTVRDCRQELYIIKRCLLAIREADPARRFLCQSDFSLISGIVDPKLKLTK
jgi:hypothetical protein